MLVKGKDCSSERSNTHIVKPCVIRYGSTRTYRVTKYTNYCRKCIFTTSFPHFLFCFMLCSVISCVIYIISFILLLDVPAQDYLFNVSYIVRILNHIRVYIPQPGNFSATLRKKYHILIFVISYG